MIALPLMLLLGAASSPGLRTNDYIVEQEGPQFWSITRADAEAAKEAMLTYLGTAHPEMNADPHSRWSESHRAEIAADIAGYDLQFRGVRRSGTLLDAKGSREIEIHGLGCSTGSVRTPFLVKYWLDVADGGRCFFNAFYDPATRRIVRFDVNGIA